jgi:NADPH-dependent glutamate synthase beta subunit-like oxidoreductase
MDDMTALPEEIEGAIAEGVEIIPLNSPVRIEGDAGNVNALIIQPQILSCYKNGRPTPRNSKEPEKRIECDIIITAIGQAIESEYFSRCGMTLKFDRIQAALSCAIPGLPGVFAGGDCIFGPATVIRAIEAGKVSAANIDEYLGYSHRIETPIEIPAPAREAQELCSRVPASNREAQERVKDFDLVGHPISPEELLQECSRCLCCDKNGLGTLKDGRDFRW